MTPTCISCRGPLDGPDYGGWHVACLWRLLERQGVGGAGLGTTIVLPQNEWQLSRPS